MLPNGIEPIDRIFHPHLASVKEDAVNTPRDNRHQREDKPVHASNSLDRWLLDFKLFIGVDGHWASGMRACEFEPEPRTPNFEFSQANRSGGATSMRSAIRGGIVTALIFMPARWVTQTTVNAPRATSSTGSGLSLLKRKR